jgi:TRAP-type transport system small permease protein
MNSLQKVIKIIEKLIHIASGRLQALIIFLLMAMLLIEVLTRYVLQSPLSIAEEMGGYFLVSITFMGLAYTWQEKGHVRITLLISRLPEKAVRPIRFITLLLATAFTLPLIKACYDLLTDSLLFESRSGSWLRTPLVYPQSIMLIGAVLLFLQLIVEIIKAVIAMRRPKENE